MAAEHHSAQQRYDILVDALLGDARVTFDASGKGFGSSALKTGGKIFAMLVGDRLVVKLPRQRVETLVASGHGAPFDPGHGRIMKEWAAIDSSSGADWLSMATEALDFVSGRR